MPLNPAQIEFVMRQSVPSILKEIENGRIAFPDDLLRYKDTAKFKEIQRQFASLPDPEAVKLFDRITELEASGSDNHQLQTLLSNFIDRYGASESLAEKVQHARNLHRTLTADIEQADWESVDRNSIMSLLQHRHRYPGSDHELEIEQLVWELTDRTSDTAVSRYLAEFPNGPHAVECQAIADSRDLWIDISTNPDPLTVSDYLLYEPGSPFRDDARRLYADLKAKEIEKMRNQPSAYKVETLKLFVKHGVFTRDELISHGVATEKTLEQIDNPPILPKLEQPEVSDPEIHSGATDVFLFGIPSSGKTCVLMGLLGAKNFDYDNSVKDAGKYADDLSIYRFNNVAADRTYGNFVAQIPGTITGYDAKNQRIKFPVNLIEMSGEEFAMRIANNAEQEVFFENMGTGATKLLTSDNNKVIFIIIDPTASGTIRIATTRNDGSTIERVVQQDTVISKIINMLAHNKKVLSKTTAIHFIMTKSDTIGTPETREAEAVNRLKALYGRSIERLREIGRDYSLNSSSGNDPLVFTFSLGKFYVGNQFEYDSTDSDKIIEALKSMVYGKKNKTFFGTIKDKVN